MASYLEQDEEFDDRRKQRRWNLPIPVRVKGSLAGGASFEEETITTDVCPSGMCLLVSKELRVNDTLNIVAPEEKFEASATVVHVNPLGANMNRVRVAFTPPAKFNRDAATKKYIYDFATENWVGYMVEGTYYNSKHEPFGQVKGSTIVRLDSDQILFGLKGDRAYDMRGNCIGHII
jgi:PilZ domain-containing protein